MDKRGRRREKRRGEERGVQSRVKLKKSGQLITMSVSMLRRLHIFHLSKENFFPLNKAHETTREDIFVIIPSEEKKKKRKKVDNKRPDV